ncbi:hypothetical protein RDI58_009472 [Solanum bulbocastanum]|uniref:Myb/SANT-like DNA-binding domain-containing protein n=1 Tax=Solanum bulbocastanum TaxID=147425 RepID=A0AAN8YKU0_SOLBU
MENDEETQSHQSGGSGSPESPRSNGRITVTVASAPPQNTLTLALPIQQSRPAGASGGGGGGSGGGGREDCWSEEATAVLIEAWGERYMELSRGNLKQKHWKDVADIVSRREDYRKTPKTDIQCKNRIDTVKKKYKLEKSKIAAGQGPSKWPFFDKLDMLIGPTAKINPTVAAGPSNLYSGNQHVPMGIPMGVRSLPQLRQHQQLQKQKQPSRKRPHMDSDTSESESEPDLSPASTDSFPPGTFQIKRPRFQKEMLNSSSLRQGGIGIGEASGKEGGNKNWGNSVRELTQAILKFGEAYEQTESAKLQQMVEMEKQRMKFAKEMELQRMQFFMNTQLEISQLKHGRSGNSNHHSNNHAAATSNHNNNNSDSSI